MLHESFDEETDQVVRELVVVETGTRIDIVTQMVTPLPILGIGQ